MNTSIALLLLATSAVVAEPKVSRNLAYTATNSARQTLDIYSPSEGKSHPIVVWIHGGAWRFGDKRGVQQKPQAFVDKGYVFVSTNYRFVPDANMGEIAGDIAKAIKWVHDHAKEHGGDPNSIFVAGHSAGAHLAALVCTDESYLKAEGLSLSDITGCFPVDTAMYDAAKQIKDRGPRRSRLYRSAFGNAEESQTKYSPITHIAKDKGIPPFLILHVASRPDSTAQSKAFAKALQASGVEAKTVAGEGKTHGTINKELGLPDDEPTKAVFEFLVQHRRDVE